MAASKKIGYKQIAVSGKGTDVPPLLKFVIIFFNQKKETIEEANSFYAFYHSNGWTTIKGTQVRNWKTKANEWIWDKYHERNFKRA